MGHAEWPTGEGDCRSARTGDNTRGSDVKLKFMRAFYAVSLFAMAIAVHGAAAKFK
jgi:hypothetical protein